MKPDLWLRDDDEEEEEEPWQLQDTAFRGSGRVLLGGLKGVKPSIQPNPYAI